MPSFIHLFIYDISANPAFFNSFLCFFFSLRLSNLLTQSLNLLEPRDPVCYVNGVTKTHMCSHIWTCLLPVHTHAHTCSVLSFAAVGRRSAFLLLTRWCSVYKNCQSHINQSFSLWAQHIRGLRNYAAVAASTLIWLHPDGRMYCSYFKMLLLHLFQPMWWWKWMWGFLQLWMGHVYWQWGLSDLFRWEQNLFYFNFTCWDIKPHKVGISKWNQWGINDKNHKFGNTLFCFMILKHMVLTKQPFMLSTPWTLGYVSLL